jgi:hypothetical protein
LRPLKACNFFTPSNIYGSYTIFTVYTPYMTVYTPYIYGLLEPINGHTVTEPVAQCHIRYRVYGVPRIRRIYGHTVWANPTFMTCGTRTLYDMWDTYVIRHVGHASYMTCGTRALCTSLNMLHTKIEHTLHPTNTHTHTQTHIHTHKRIHDSHTIHKLTHTYILKPHTHTQSSHTHTPHTQHTQTQNAQGGPVRIQSSRVARQHAKTVDEGEVSHPHTPAYTRIHIQTHRHTEIMHICALLHTHIHTLSHTYTCAHTFSIRIRMM